ncbi:hypothetical protein HF670_11880 [Acidithiobacillus thiooxidans]|uniref:hypothetical protein n=1 Tax=Acidithiobacillus thiooxidans TaxID=930 RepID=UPI001C06581B|nr:hypothetical protein [Acidithiobacillus thiooxidans]MBU2840245.1 hypothetical protein [Acidithiobacillus thiooxidans]
MGMNNIDLASIEAELAMAVDQLEDAAEKLGEASNGSIVADDLKRKAHAIRAGILGYKIGCKVILNGSLFGWKHGSVAIVVGYMPYGIEVAPFTKRGTVHKTLRYIIAYERWNPKGLIWESTPSYYSISLQDSDHRHKELENEYPVQ